MRALDPFQERNDPVHAGSPTGRARRLITWFLLILSLIVCLRLATETHGAPPAARSRPATLEPRRGDAAAAARASRGPALAITLEEPTDLVVAGMVHRTVVVRGQRPASGELQIGWEARVDGATTASGFRAIAPSRGHEARVVVSFAAPEVAHPVGMDLWVEAREAGEIAARARFPFTLHPRAGAERLAGRLGRARIALFDPQALAGPALRGIGISPDVVVSHDDLALRPADLIIVGPGGFARGQEALGPILAARVRHGTPVLLLDQPTLPPTFSAELRLWPSFARAAAAPEVLAERHPLLEGMAPSDAAAYLAGPAGTRPFLPPTRGNFKVIAGVRAGAGGAAVQEGIRLVEVSLGAGTIVAVQAPLCGDYPRDPRARILLTNAISYLLDRPRAALRAVLYGRDPVDLHVCLARLAPRLGRLTSLDGVDLVVAPADWLAPRQAASAALPAPSEIARFLRGGGTVVVVNPQALVREYLERLVGSAVQFVEAAGPSGVLPRTLPLLEGIADGDLALLDRPGRAELRLRPRPGADGIEAILIAPGLSEHRVGRGRLIVLTLPDADACTAPRVSSLISRLLTNLGVPLDEASAIDPASLIQDENARQAW